MARLSLALKVDLLAFSGSNKVLRQALLFQKLVMRKRETSSTILRKVAAVQSVNQQKRPLFHSTGFFYLCDTFLLHAFFFFFLSKQKKHVNVSPVNLLLV
eukprot:m.204438 g.204438  ORF g.204438 m.204438 type:complete len:100 (-) comp16885_c1_seq1:207-506(-)